MDWGVLASLAKAAAALAVGFPLLMYLLQDRLIFHPQRAAESRLAQIRNSFPAAKEAFLDAADGTRLHAWHLAGSPLVLYFGGNAEEVSWMLGEAERAPGTGWLLVDYRGYGASGGSPSQAALSSDALAWYDFAVQTLEARSIFVFGRSLGSGVAVQVAARRPVAGVIAVAPFDSLVEVARHHYPYLPVGWMLKHPFDSAALAPAIRAPLLCLVAERDNVIPLERSQRLYEAWGGPKRWVELLGAGHNSTDGTPEFWEGIRDFIR